MPTGVRDGRLARWWGAACGVVASAGLAGAQDALLQAWHWDYPKPNCQGHAGPSLAAAMAPRSGEWRAAGFTHVWLPPLSQSSGGPCSNGYDPRDLYDYGQIGGRTGLGTGAEVLQWLQSLAAAGLRPVADVVYNHRDGGDWEDNPVARAWAMGQPALCAGGATPYPVNGKFRWRLALGGASGNGVGDYYFKWSSASGQAAYHARQYKLYFRTQATPHDPASIAESEPNGGADCGQQPNRIHLGRDILGALETVGGCNTDEYWLRLEAGDYAAAGDWLEIYVEEPGGAGTGIDLRPYGAWSSSRGADIVGELAAQTRTDFRSMPSGLGAMDRANFKPNGLQPTCLAGDEDYPYFYFDVEQAQPSTGLAYRDWNAWLWSALGIRGWRMDAVKHYPAWFAGLMLEELHASGRTPTLAVGEHYTFDAVAVKGWIDAASGAMSPAARAAIPVRAFDFELRQSLKRACDDPAQDARQVFQSGLVDRAGASGYNAVAFLNNHDFRTSGEHLLQRAHLAYAYILLNNRVGLPCVFLADYDGTDIYGPSAPLPGLKVEIDRLLELHRLHAHGASVEYLNRYGTPRASSWLESGPQDALFFQLRGGPGGRDMLVAINFEGARLRANHQIDTASAPSGSRFALAAGTANHVAPVVETSPGGLVGSVYLDLPPWSYAVWVEEPEPPTAYCFGEAAACPCANAGAPGRGCANSANAAGALLAAGGSASIAADTLVLHGSGMPNSAALYFQGTTTIASGAGTPFGDGLRCAGGSVLRLGTRVNRSGASSYPAVGELAVSRRGAVLAPGLRHYQVWYRNAAAYCTPSTYNLSNGLSVPWAP
ncbi:MAG: hypothetical protein RL112_2504 [Planctomycetota bacterium]|jgi:alpha-amylase